MSEKTDILDRIYGFVPKNKVSKTLYDSGEEIARLRSDLKEALEALEPFATGIGTMMADKSAFERARSVLKKARGEE